jgi:hypothetical protein
MDRAAKSFELIFQSALPLSQSYSRSSCEVNGVSLPGASLGEATSLRTLGRTIRDQRARSLVFAGVGLEAPCCSMHDPQSALVVCVKGMPCGGANQTMATLPNLLANKTIGLAWFSAKKWSNGRL